MRRRIEHRCQRHLVRCRMMPLSQRLQNRILEQLGRLGITTEWPVREERDTELARQFQRPIRGALARQHA